MNTSDAQLLLLTSRGDETAARRLWEAHGPALLAYARVVLGTGGREEAADVVQEVMCAILRTPRGKLREVRDARAWLLVLTRRGCLNALRAAGRERRRVRAARLGEGGEEGAAPREVALERALEALPRGLREVVHLKHAGMLTFDQMALSLGKSRGTLASRYAAAMELLRRGLELGEDVDGPVAAQRRGVAGAAGAMKHDAGARA